MMLEIGVGRPDFSPQFARAKTKKNSVILIGARPRSREADKLWRIAQGSGAFVGLAIHIGHELRSGIEPVIAIDEDTRFLEEDSFADRIAALCGTTSTRTPERYRQ